MYQNEDMQSEAIEVGKSQPYSTYMFSLREWVSPAASDAHHSSGTFSLNQRGIGPPWFSPILTLMYSSRGNGEVEH